MPDAKLERADEQSELFELSSRRQAKLQRVDIAKIDIPGEAAFDAADVKELADSIRRMSLLHVPILQKEGGRYVPIVGRRRCAALKLLASLDGSYQHVDMYVRTDHVSESDVAKMVLTENARRSANVLAELASIEALMKGDRMSIEGVAKSIGQNLAWVRRRLLLKQLLPALRKQMEKGHLSFLTAAQIAKLDRRQQQAVLDSYQDKKHDDKDAVISGADVSAVLSKDTVALPQELFKPLPPVDAPSNSWSAAALVGQLREWAELLEDTPKGNLPRVIAAMRAAAADMERDGNG